MNLYDKTRQQYRPVRVRWLLIAESPPPAPSAQSSRGFYYTDRTRVDDRLFTNTIRALYSEAAETAELELERDKPKWLHRFQQDGWYMIEALEQSQNHEVTKRQRQELIGKGLPQLIERVGRLADADTKIILIKSNVFEVVAEPLRKAGFRVLNTELIDYPGQYNQQAYREKLAKLSKY